MKAKESLQYNGKVLLKERKKQKISRIDIALKLTLNEHQIKSIEENLATGFTNDYFKKLSIKRYAKVLVVPIDKVIPVNNNTNDEGNILNDVQNIEIKKYSFILPLALVLFLFANIFVFNPPEEEVDYLTLNDSIDNISDPIPKEADENALPIEINENDTPPEVTQINYDSSAPDNGALDFICTIDTATDLTNFSTKNPEKPATYFFIISDAAQTFCTIDSNNILKTYNLAKGERMTHKGTAPFKLQLNPSISELYFEGWKVQLQNDDFFIKLHPGKINNLN
jgi:transcriptional regulator with XRE-family HTH domain